MSLSFAHYSEFLIRILLASLLGGIIGLERDIHGRAAGLRTHLLVSLGAAVFTILSEIISQSTHATGFPADPARIAAQVVSGIGFLGAGVILKEGANVRGLTTAACLWSAAAIGMAAGGGYYEIAIITTGISLLSLIFLKFFERFYAKDTYRVLSVRASLEVDASQIIEIAKDKRVKVLNCDIEKNYETGVLLTKLSLRLRYRGITDKLAHGIIKSLETSPLSLAEIKWEHI
ncbi:MAG: MgtC/SapB family protein [Anaerolineae bacterium]|jgi:putative Mg2+ transporter-C (MgtC) family protein|nr:MgtC/SapB family protein [Anaerolineae bacterium]MBT7073292.1 MgtC/SapB family protein [Anaerolineae bacterium]MBT7783712.1 MgtC/SapB family protein [Anaerolineae bacterium]